MARGARGSDEIESRAEPGYPAMLTRVAAECCSDDPEQRPSLADVADDLTLLYERLAGVAYVAYDDDEDVSDEDEADEDLALTDVAMAVDAVVPDDGPTLDRAAGALDDTEVPASSASVPAASAEAAASMSSAQGDVALTRATDDSAGAVPASGTPPGSPAATSPATVPGRPAAGASPTTTLPGRVAALRMERSQSVARGVLASDAAAGGRIGRSTSAQSLARSPRRPLSEADMASSAGLRPLIPLAPLRPTRAAGASSLTHHALHAAAQCRGLSLTHASPPAAYAPRNAGVM